MIRALWNTRSGMQAMQDKLDSVSNNISNSETTGYKKVDVSFKDLVYEQLERNGYPTNKNGTNQHLTGSGVQATEWLRNDAQGSIKATGKDSNLAIDGLGYFKVTQSDGTAAYTRDGNFNLDASGKLVDSSGNNLEVNFSGDKKTLVEGKFSINEDGTIIDNSGDSSVTIGKINIYQPMGQDSMISAGSSLFTAKIGTQINQVSNSTIKQGFVESSNVDITTEMTDMLVAQRAFELNSKALSTVDKMMGIINSLKG